MNILELGRRINLKCNKRGVTERGSPTTTFDRNELNEPQLLKKIAAQMSKIIPKETDLLAGIGNGGIPITRALAEETGLPYVILKKWEGQMTLIDDVSNAKRIVIVDDTVCRGKRMAEAQSLLGSNADTVLCIVKRGEQSSNLKIKTKALFTGEELRKIREKV